jgi:hypothetical protein
MDEVLADEQIMLLRWSGATVLTVEAVREND